MAQGMPQLDFANPLTTSQVVWLAIIFGVLYLLLCAGRCRRWRRAGVAGRLDRPRSRAAREAKQQSDTAVAELTEASRQAHAEAQAEIARAVAAVQAATSAASAKVHARLDAQLAEAEGRSRRPGALPWAPCIRSRPRLRRRW